MTAHSRIMLFCLALGVLLLLALSVSQAPAAFTIPWNTVDGGGGGGCYRAVSGFALCGTAGQPDASHQQLQGQIFKLRSGFWSGPRLIRYRIYLPLVKK